MIQNRQFHSVINVREYIFARYTRFYTLIHSSFSSTHKYLFATAPMKFQTFRVINTQRVFVKGDLASSYSWFYERVNVAGCTRELEPRLVGRNERRSDVPVCTIEHSGNELKRENKRERKRERERETSRYRVGDD